MKRHFSWLFAIVVLTGVLTAAAAPANAQVDWSNAYVEGSGNNVIIRDVRFMGESYSVCWEWDTSSNLLYRGAVTGTTGDPCMAAGTAAVTICVTNAADGTPIAGATVLLDGVSGTTGADGCVEFSSVSFGAHSLNVSAPGCSTLSQTINVIQPTQSINVSLSCGPATGNYRIELTWGSLPTNLDANLLVPGGYHVAFDNMGNAASYPFAALNINDTTSFGPEIITIYMPVAGYYRYFVHNYSENYNPGESGYPLTQSQAAVTLYRGATELQSWDVPRMGAGYWWHVFDLDAVNQTIITVDVLQYSEPPFP